MNLKHAVRLGATILGVTLALASGSGGAVAACPPGQTDNDGDGYCTPQDCNDNSPNINPGAEEDCFDTRDNDCDTFVDEADPDCGGCPDADGDGYPSASCGGNDCNDGNAGVHPGATELCSNGVDDDCDTLIDAADPSCGGGCPDADSDGYPAASCGGTDCNDLVAAIHPGAPEDCLDGRDNDCDGLVDGDDPSCGGCADNDGDGFPSAACGGSDCDDGNAAVNPGAPEGCGNGIDDDCDTLIDGTDPDCQGCPPEDPDADGDGFCASVDCDDSNPTIHPGAEEDCGNGLDDDCDTFIDQADADCPPCPDADGDGRQRTACGGTDCDDADPTVWHIPGEVQNLRFATHDGFGWGEPLPPGGTAPVYDALRSDTPSSFAGALCLEGDGSDTSAMDAQSPLPGSFFSYLVRAENACGSGTLGFSSGGVQHVGPACP